jgi:serine/threonine protein kinase
VPAAGGQHVGRGTHARAPRGARRRAVYDVLEQDGRAFIVMEYVEGISLAAHLASGPLPASEVRKIGRQLASALAAAQGVIHRDLKPADLQVMRDGSIKVLDFGVARLMPAMSPIVDTTVVEAPVEHSLGGNPGTPLCMALINDNTSTKDVSPGPIPDPLPDPLPPSIKCLDPDGDVWS